MVRWPKATRRPGKGAKSPDRARSNSRPPSQRAPKKTWWRRIRRVLLVGLVLCSLLALSVTAWIWLTFPDVSDLEKNPPSTTAFIELRKEQAKEQGKKFNLKWRWKSLQQISPYLRHAVVHAEDGKFWKHEGVDWDAIEQAAEKNWEEGTFSVGGSTITQQVAKNLYLSPSRNPLRKLKEVFIARSLERHLSKKRILEIYLNIAEWGDGIFGADAAANRWFGVSALNLSPWQAARLAVALPNPFLRAPNVSSEMLSKKARRLLRAMKRDGLITEAMFSAATGGASSSPAQASGASSAAPAKMPAEKTPEPDAPAEPEIPPDSKDEPAPPSAAKAKGDAATEK